LVRLLLTKEAKPCRTCLEIIGREASFVTSCRTSLSAQQDRKHALISSIDPMRTLDQCCCPIANGWQGDRSTKLNQRRRTGVWRRASYGIACPCVHGGRWIVTRILAGTLHICNWAEIKSTNNQSN
jgi:hypothetical protein